MSYQYKREPLTAAEATHLANAYRTEKERLVIWTFLDSGLRLGELAQLRKTDVDIVTRKDVRKYPVDK